MSIPDLRIELVMPAVLVGLGTLLLCLAVFDLAGALGARLWLRASPRAARRARARASLTAYQEGYTRHGRRR